MTGRKSAWRRRAPWWADYLLEHHIQLERKLDKLMASEQDVQDALGELFNLTDLLISKVADLAAGGGATADQLNDLLNQVNAERDKVNTALANVDGPQVPPVEPPA